GRDCQFERYRACGGTSSDQCDHSSGNLRLAGPESLLLHSLRVQLLLARYQTARQGDDQSHGATECFCRPGLASAADSCSHHGWHAGGDGPFPASISESDDRLGGFFAWSREFECATESRQLIELIHAWAPALALSAQSR